MNAEFYVRRILPHAKKEGLRLLGTDKWVYQQDGATPPTSNISQQYCKNNYNNTDVVYIIFSTINKIVFSVGQIVTSQVSYGKNRKFCIKSSQTG